MLTTATGRAAAVGQVLDESVNIPIDCMVKLLTLRLGFYFIGKKKNMVLAQHNRGYKSGENMSRNNGQQSHPNDLVV
jgi:hypothetical protein